MSKADLLEVGSPDTEKPKVFVGIALDESSSMNGIYDATVSNFNEQFDDLVAGSVDTDTKVSFVKFASEATPLFFNETIDQLEKISDKNYSPNGMTALFDAVGLLIDRIKKEVKGLKEGSYSVLLIIVSDGEENHSKEYKPAAVKATIKELQDDKHWTFTFLGANQDITEIQEATGIAAGNIMNFMATSEGITAGASNLRSSSRGYFAARSKGVMTDNVMYCSMAAPEYENRDDLMKTAVENAQALKVESKKSEDSDAESSAEVSSID